MGHVRWDRTLQRPACLWQLRRDQDSVDSVERSRWHRRPQCPHFFRKPRRDQDGVDKQMEAHVERRRQAKKTMGGSTARWLLEKATLA